MIVKNWWSAVSRWLAALLLLASPGITVAQLGGGMGLEEPAPCTLGCSESTCFKISDDCFHYDETNGKTVWSPLHVGEGVIPDGTMTRWQVTCNSDCSEQVIATASSCGAVDPETPGQDIAKYRCDLE